MGLTARQQRFIDRFLPGVLDAMSKLGPGEFFGHDPKLDCLKTDEVFGVVVRFWFTLSDGMTVEIRSGWNLMEGCAPFVPPSGPFNPDEWERYYYSFHYGRGVKEVVFRIDLDESHGHHVHIPPDTDYHTPADDVVPDTRALKPLEFIQMVSNYRVNDVYPLTRKAARGRNQRPRKRKKT
jgi:hypothetical protein